MRKIPVNFSAYSQEQYKLLIASPSQSQAYFERFNRPLAESLIKRFGPPARIIDIACGFAHELEFFRGNSQVSLTGVDVSWGMLARAKKNVPFGDFMRADVAKSRPFSGLFHGFIMVNAMIYCPGKMGKYAYSSLADGGMGTMNFRDSGNPSNAPFFEDCVRKGCLDIRFGLEVNGRRFTLRAMDYSQRKDIFRNLGQQAYFQSRQEIEDFLSLIGFEAISHGAYSYKSPENEHNVTDVYTLEKRQK